MPLLLRGKAAFAEAKRGILPGVLPSFICWKAMFYAVNGCKWTCKPWRTGLAELYFNKNGSNFRYDKMSRLSSPQPAKCHTKDFDGKSGQQGKDASGWH